MDAGHLRPTVLLERGQHGRAIRFGEPNGNCTLHIWLNSNRLGILVLWY